MFKKFQTREGLMGAGSVFLTVATLGLLVAIAFGVMAAIGLNQQNDFNKTITVTGSGEAFAIPDVATFTFTARAEADEVATAQEAVSEQVAGVLAELEALGVDETDIRTTSYNSYPRYEWIEKRVLCTEFSCPPVEGERTLVGYEQSQSIRVKVRDLEIVSDVLMVLGSANVDSLYGPSFEVDDPDAAMTEARTDAIEDAREKAEELAASLGVRLGKVVSFSENDGGHYPMPIFARASMDMAEGGAMAAPQLPVGENEINATVSITYKIK